MGQQTSRQELISQELDDQQTRDWFTLNVALREATKALAISLHHKISVIHKNVKTSCRGLGECNENCSATKTNSTQWCRPCSLWQNEILSLCEPAYQHKITWERYHSAQWPSNPYEFARVFIPRAHRFYYKSNEFHEDIRYTLSFIENCVEFEVPRETIQKAWVVRNSFKRKGKMRVRKNYLHDAMTVLLALLESPSISDHGAITPAVKKLRALNGELEESSCCIS